MTFLKSSEYLSTSSRGSEWSMGIVAMSPENKVRSTLRTKDS